MQNEKITYIQSDRHYPGHLYHFPSSVGCANNEVVPLLTGHTYGFWGGLWHGIIAPVDLIISLWRHDYCVFAPNNNGALYAFGFILGSGGRCFSVGTGHHAPQEEVNSEFRGSASPFTSGGC